ncbi:MAG TPA: hypothetical protein VH912_20475 [Streptosporangiaceae bacterium]|jgi:hypothetical protein
MTRPPGRLKEQVQETVREIPVQAARLGLFAVGRTLLLTDRVRKDYKEARESGLRPVLERLRDDAEQLATKVVGKVTERVSGPSESAPDSAADPSPTTETPVARPPARKVNTSLAAEPEAVPDPKVAAEPERPAAADRVTKVAPDAAAAPKPAPPPAPDRVTKLTADSLPVPNYDAATLASVRARLRSLTAVQVSQLRDYEQAHGARADFLRMYENRIAKLTAEH